MLVSPSIRKLPRKVPDARALKLRDRGRVLRTVRQSAGLTQRELADIAEVTRESVAAWESPASTRSVRRWIAEAVAAALHVPLHVIFDVEPQPERGSNRARTRIVAASTRRPAAAVTARRRA